MLFDSWAEGLPDNIFEEVIIAPTKKLVARLRALIRRAAGDAAPAVALGDVRVDVAARAADIDAGRISALSYVGAGLIGLPEGQSILWPDPSGATRRLTPVLVEDPDPLAP